jgi:hypothetical protein
MFTYPLCGKEMHDNWQLYNGIKKLGLKNKVWRLEVH